MNRKSNVFTWIFIFGSLLILLFSCKKKEKDEEPQPTPTTPDYYFKISYGGTDYYHDNDMFQSGYNGPFEFGGYVPGGNLFAGKALGFSIVFEDTVANLNLVTLLKGKRFYFNGYDGPYPSVSITHSLPTEVRYSQDDPGNNYYVDIKEIIFLRNEKTLIDWDIYAVKASFKTRIEQDTTFADASGEFYMQCSHGNF